LLEGLFVGGAQGEDVVGGVEVFEAVILGGAVDVDGAAAEDMELFWDFEGERVWYWAGLRRDIVSGSPWRNVGVK